MANLRDFPCRPQELVETWVGRFQTACRDRGIRVTPQRVAVYRALAADRTHPTADRLHETLAPALPTLSLTTVYRILESLEREGLVRRVSTTGGGARFDANIHPHQHLVCRTCGAIADVDEGGLSPLTPPDLDGVGFTAEAVDIQIVGICHACRDREANAARA